MMGQPVQDEEHFVCENSISDELLILVYTDIAAESVSYFG